MVKKDIDKICEKYRIRNYTINEDGSIDVNGDVDLCDSGLIELPLKFNKVFGFFDCGYNKLTSLKGSPKYVELDFNCEHNDLTNLEYGPEYVGGFFDCNHNFLVTLKESPKEILGDFNCSYNRLTSLEGCVMELGGLDCSNNKLTSLKYGPEIINICFDCSSNYLTSLEYGPVEVGESFYCSNNYLTSLEHSPKKVGDDYFCNNNKLMDLYGISEEIGQYVYCGGTNPISVIFHKEDLDTIKRFNGYKIIKDNKVNLKRLKYFMELFDIHYSLDKIEKHYEIIQ